MLFDDEITAAARALLDACRARGLRLATAESCTGGLIMGALTEIPGSSEVVERGFVTYANDAKREMIGVAEALLAEHGAVSREVARAMADGALAAANASGARVDLALATTGVAGPGPGGSKPEGLVHFAAARLNGPLLHVEERFGALGRTQVRLAAVRRALALGLEAAG